MPKYDSTEAPFSVTVNGDAEGYTGHHDERPLKVNLDLDADVVKALDDIGVHVEGGEVQTAITPAEAYHFADDLNHAADSCWGSAEYLVTVVHSSDAREGPLETVLTTIKAPDRESAVRRAKSLVETTAERSDAATHRVRAGLAEDSDEFRVYRADTMTTVRTNDEDDDSDN